MSGATLRKTEHGQMMGTGDRYHEYQCNGCHEMVSTWEDSGHWGKTTVYCSPCRERRFPGAGERNSDRPLHSDAPAEYATAELDDYPDKLGRNMRLWPYKQKMVGIRGKPGVGKTHLCWAIERGWSRKGMRVKVLDCQEAKVQWMKSFNRDELTDKWSRMGLLILDDITRVNATDGWVNVIKGVIDYRTKNHKPTIITTMSGPQAIEDQYGEDLRSRFKYFKWLTLGGKDRRDASD